MTAVKSFIAGFLATLVFHQPALLILHVIGIAGRGPYSLELTKPFGVPSVISLAFWGGVWGIILWLVVRKQLGAAYWAWATLFGAVAPTLVAGFVVAPLKGQPMAGGGKVSAIATGLIINAAWGLGTAVFLRMFRGRAAAPTS
jgi:hypothetical protein